MAGKSTTDSCCLTLPLKVEKWQSDRLNKRFELARKIYNTLLRFELKKLHTLEQTKEYREIEASLLELYRSEKKNTKEYKALLKKRGKLRKDAGFTNNDFEKDIKNFYKCFRENIASSVAVKCIAAQVWAAFDRMFYGNGKKVHFKRPGEIRSLKGHSATNKSGGVEIMFRGDYIEWKGLRLPIKLDPSNDYEKEMLSYRVKYCRIIKEQGKQKDRWYVQLLLEGKPAIKMKKGTGEVVHPVGEGAVGIDIGTQTIAYVSRTESKLLELADGVKNIEKEKRILQRKLDRSRRAMNPDNYNEDGTIRRGVKLTRNKSKRYQNVQRKLAFLQHQQADIRKRQHTELANHLLSLGNQFYVEKMAWPGLARRAKETTISEKTGKYNKKKRFGKSIGNKAPAMLISILDQKLKSRGYSGVCKVSTFVRASQFNHITGEYVKKELKERWNTMPDGKRIQRDLYSAFLLQHMNEEQSEFDRIGLEKDYNLFLVQHDRMIEELKKNPKSITSMGIRRKAS